MKVEFHPISPKGGLTTPLGAADCQMNTISEQNV